MSEEQKPKPQFSTCPIGCKIGKLDAKLVDEIDIHIASGYTLEDVVERFPLASLNTSNVSAHRKRHLDKAKALAELEKQGIKPTRIPKTIEEEAEQIREQNPKLAKELERMTVEGSLPFKSIDIVIERIGICDKMLKDLYSLPSPTTKYCAMYETVMQKWIEIYSRLTGEAYKAQNIKGEDISSVVAELLEQKNKRDKIIKPLSSVEE